MVLLTTYKCMYTIQCFDPVALRNQILIILM
jgi:hypothetical protein